MIEVLRFSSKRVHSAMKKGIVKPKDTKYNRTVKVKVRYERRIW